MSPDSPETRIGKLEQTVAALKQQVHDLGEDVRAFGPLVAQMAILTHDVARIEVTVNKLASNFEDREKQTRRDQEAALKDSRNWRRALILGSFTVLAAVIAAAATIIASGGH